MKYSYITAIITVLERDVIIVIAISLSKHCLIYKYYFEFRLIAS